MPTEPLDGGTPIDPDEAEGLLPGHVATRGELNELEQENIEIGLEWATRATLSGKRRRDDSVYDPDKLAVRFHHRLVAIHPFVNGNGRHARMMADLLALQQVQPRFSWGGRRLETTSEMRAAYIVPSGEPMPATSDRCFISPVRRNA